MSFREGRSELEAFCQIIPRAIDYFTGKALEFEVVDEDDGYSEEADDDNDAGNSDNVSILKASTTPFCRLIRFFSNQESEEAVPVRRRTAGLPKGRGAGTAPSDNVNPEECKQQ